MANAELIMAENARTWTFEEAQKALADIRTLEEKGVWTTPEWARAIYRAYGEANANVALKYANDRIHGAFESRIRELEVTLLDLCDNELRTKSDIQGETGETDDRCQAIADLVNNLFERYEWKDGQWQKTS